ncbi:helicase [Secundilactobacillus kimchicus]|uniref:DEAD/DEAH box helicase n=1 Tax=Secundilactobacillus kimchicus TaxID=528209 RepID=UPI001C0107AD|nr:DEAD/DEAH box helicase [Secundilactobacillus kimchicus]MBT9670432.1 helicase [Secundilactobacillus kimchicus]
MVKLYDYQQKIVTGVRNSLANHHKGVVIVSPPGSGKSVIISDIARRTIAKGGHVLFTVHRQELINQITESFQEAGVDMTHVTIMTVMRIANRLDQLPKPTLIICDESHHSLAKTYRKIYDYFADVPRLGFTGTLWRMNGQGFHDIYSDIVLGPSVKWLIEHEKLAPFNYYSFKLVDDSKLKTSSTGDYTNTSMSDAVGKTIFGDVVATYRKLVPGQKAILYAHDVEHSKAVAQAFNEAGIPAAHADSKTPKDERQQVMDDFKSGKILVLCGVDLYGEGVNVTDCSVSILLRPTKSLALYLQQSMRSMRYRPGKTATIIDHVANFTEFGLPDEPHQWTLDDTNKSKSSTTSSDIKPVTVCEQCFGTFYRTGDTCPYCGAIIPVKERKIEVDEKAELQKVEANERLARAKKIIESNAAMAVADKTPGQLNSMAELQAYAELHNYKKGWVYYQAKMKGLIH